MRILVPQAESVGALAVIRSLGRAGHVVHACSADPAALGLHSQLAARAAISPAPGERGFLAWVRAYVREQAIDLIIPSESFVLGVQGALDELLPLFPCATDAATTLRAMSKWDLFETLLSSRAPHLPKTLLVRDLALPPELAAIAALGAPLFIKVDGRYATGGEPGQTWEARSTPEALQLLAALHPRFSRALVQAPVSGQGVGAFFLLSRGQVVAEYMHRRLHEVPWRGGVSSLRETFWHQGIRDDALAKLRLSGWEGVAMMEYRWDPRTDAFAFLEMNARFWGSLHLALYAGLDLPALLVTDAARRLPQGAPPLRARLGVRCRHPLLDVGHLLSKLRDSELPRWAKARAALEFAALSLSPRVRSDLLFPGDRALALRAVRAFVQKLGAWRRAAGQPGSAARLSSAEAA